MSSCPDSLKILHLLAFHLWSGPADPTAHLLLAQRAAGLQSTLCYDTVHAPSTCEEPIKPRLDELSITPPFELALSPKSRPWQFVADFFRLRARLGDYDIVHTHMSHDHQLALLARRGRRPLLVRSVHAARSFSLARGRARALQAADGLIVSSEKHRRWLLNNLHLAADKVAVIMPGLDSSYWQVEATAEERAALNLPPGPKVAMVAMMQQDRGHREVIRAWKKVVEKVPAARLIMVGEGEGQPAFRQLARDLGIADQVCFTGYLTGPALRALYQAVEMTVLVSTGNDLSARAMAESWASGKVTAVLDAPDEHEKLRRAALLEGAARLSPVLVASDEDDLGSKLAAFLQNSSLLGELGTAGRQLIINERTLAAEELAVRAFYRQLMAGRR